MKTSKKTIKQDKVEVVNSQRKTGADLKAEKFVSLLEENAYNQTKAYKQLVGRLDMSSDAAAVAGSTLVRKPKVQALLAGTAKAASVALDKMVRDDKNFNHFQATKLALAYEHGTPVSKSENVNVNLTLEDILLG